MTPSAFEVAVTDAQLDDLRSRLGRTRLTRPVGEGTWSAGVDQPYLVSLLEYWRETFDLRRHVSSLNTVPHFRASIGGARVHYVWRQAKRPAGSRPRPPILLNHGWPSCFVEMLALADRLVDPAAYGGDPADAFDVVIPSLPGFLYSDLPHGPLTRERMAATLHSLMTEVLGYSSYGVFGGDIGGAVAGWMGALYPDQVLGVHLIHPPLPSDLDPKTITPPERAFLDADAAYDETDGGYSAIMGTRPDTIATALGDSPAGLAAWIIDKFRDWSDCDGDVESRIDRDTLLTIITLYWASGAIGSSFRQYYDWAHNRARPTITVPTAVTLSHEPLFRSFPRSLAERCCTDLRMWSTPESGGHFLPLEEPRLMAADLKTFFSSLSPA